MIIYENKGDGAQSVNLFYLFREEVTVAVKNNGRVQREGRGFHKRLTNLFRDHKNKNGPPPPFLAGTRGLEEPSCGKDELGSLLPGDKSFPRSFVRRRRWVFFLDKVSQTPSRQDNAKPQE